jgi:hypothetical protein
MEVKQVQMTHRLQAVKLSGRLSSSFLLFHGWRIASFYSLYSSPQLKCAFASIHCQVKMTDSKLQCDLPLLRGSAFQLSIWMQKWTKTRQIEFLPATALFNPASSTALGVGGQKFGKREVWQPGGHRVFFLYAMLSPALASSLLPLLPHSLVQPDNLFFPGEHSSYLKAYVPWVW